MLESPLRRPRLSRRSAEKARTALISVALAVDRASRWLFGERWLTSVALPRQVTVAASLFGETTQLVPGLEPKGSAGADEDLARTALFVGLAIGLAITVLVGAFFLVFPVLELMISSIFAAIMAMFPKEEEEPEPPPPPPPPREVPIKPLFASSLDAMSEFFRVMPYASTSQVRKSFSLHMFCSLPTQVLFASTKPAVLSPRVFSSHACNRPPRQLLEPPPPFGMPLHTGSTPESLKPDQPADDRCSARCTRCWAECGSRWRFRRTRLVPDGKPSAEDLGSLSSARSFIAPSADPSAILAQRRTRPPILESCPRLTRASFCTPLLPLLWNRASLLSSFTRGGTIGKDWLSRQPNWTRSGAPARRLHPSPCLQGI